MRNPHWGSIKWPHANRVCAQLWRYALQLGAVHQTQICKFFSISIFSTLSLIYIVDFGKIHLLEMDLGELTIYVYMLVHIHHYFSSPKLPIQKSFPRTFIIMCDVSDHRWTPPPSSSFPVIALQSGNSKFRQNSSNSISDWSDHLTTLYLL